MLYVQSNFKLTLPYLIVKGGGVGDSGFGPPTIR